MRVQEPPDVLLQLRERILLHFNLPRTSLNSISVHYYPDGDTCYTPAHQDTVSCLDPSCPVAFELFLGADRDFLVCKKDDVGKTVTSTMEIAKKWQTFSGDLLAYGR
jgi:hypothetical protein